MQLDHRGGSCHRVWTYGWTSTTAMERRGGCPRSEAPALQEQKCTQPLQNQSNDQAASQKTTSSSSLSSSDKLLVGAAMGLTSGEGALQPPGDEP
mmetsp:Transcript_67711/g.171427  ORF Transcript_67711/g.171427 Transcript_67711/m.171427 type:complete len:95 (+) Transcript_67711:17-301(+)